MVLKQLISLMENLCFLMQSKSVSLHLHNALWFKAKKLHMSFAALKGEYFHTYLQQWGDALNR